MTRAMRRTRQIGAAVVLVLALGACVTSTAGPHWRGTGERVVQIRINLSAQDAAVAPAVAHAAQVWSDRVDRLRFDVSAGTCPAGANCVDVQRGPGVAETAGIGWDSAGHMYDRAGVLTFDSAPWDPEMLANAACHGLGHVAGLDHSPLPGMPGPCLNGSPTPWDVATANRLYDHED